MDNHRKLSFSFGISIRYLLVLHICAVFLAFILLPSYSDGASQPPLQEYVFKEAGFAISFPTSWKVVVQSHQGKELTFSVTYQTKTPGIHGFVQVWNIPDLKGFIEQSLHTAPAIEDVMVQPIRAGNLFGYYLTFRQLVEDGKVYIRDLYLKNGDQKVYRITMMVPEELLNPAQEELFQKIVASFKQL